MGVHRGKNFNGDVYVVGGGSLEKSSEELWPKDIWIIPQDQCSAGLAKCAANETCVEELVVSSRKVIAETTLKPISDAPCSYSWFFSGT